MVDRLQVAMKKGMTAEQQQSDASWQSALRAHMSRESTEIGDRIAGVLKSIDEEVSQFGDFMEFADDLQILDVIIKESGSCDSFVTGLWQSFSHY